MMFPSRNRFMLKANSTVKNPYGITRTPLSSEHHGLYSEFGNNFLKSMIRLSKEKPELGVVFDQVGTPTYAGDLADIILQIIDFSEPSWFY